MLTVDEVLANPLVYRNKVITVRGYSSTVALTTDDPKYEGACSPPIPYITLGLRTKKVGELYGRRIVVRGLFKDKFFPLVSGEKWLYRGEAYGPLVNATVVEVLEDRCSESSPHNGLPPRFDD